MSLRQSSSHLVLQKRIRSSLICTSLDAPQAPQNRQYWQAAEKHMELAPLFPPHVVISVAINFSKCAIRSVLTLSTIGHVPSLIHSKFSLQATRQSAHGTVAHSLCVSAKGTRASVGSRISSLKDILSVFGSTRLSYKSRSILKPKATGKAIKKG